MFITQQTERCHYSGDQYVSVMSPKNTVIKIAATDKYFLSYLVRLAGLGKAVKT
jgi:hypothetical protein